MIINIDGAVVGRVGCYVAKQLLRGEQMDLVNCEKSIITGNRENIKQIYHQKRSRVGSGLTGPKYPKVSDRMVKRIIRGMLPNYREGRGREAWKRLKCYNGVPKQFEGKEITQFKTSKKDKFVEIKEISRCE